MFHRRIPGFTIAELLIALAILGEIATFTIPKILSAQQKSHFNSHSKETMGMVAAAFQAAKLQGTITGTGRLGDLTPYMNYVSVATSGQLDDLPGYGSLSCNGTNKCYRLHGGGLLYDRCGLGGTGSTSAMLFHFDPDGKYSGSTTTPGKSILVQLFYNGRLYTREYEGNTISTGCGNWIPNYNEAPDWFSW